MAAFQKGHPYHPRRPKLPGHFGYTDEQGGSPTERRFDLPNQSSTTTPWFREQVARLSALGMSKKQICRKLKIDHQTLDKRLSEPEQQELVTVYREEILRTTTPLAKDALENQLRSGDGDLGLNYLKAAGVLGGNEGPRTAIQINFGRDTRARPVQMGTIEAEKKELECLPENPGSNAGATPPSNES